jgi:predicted enzyme related to lactoylglutathione lyase
MPEAFLVNIDVPDIERGQLFYEQALGFERSRLLFDGTVAEMVRGGMKIYLLPNEQGSPAVGGAIPRDYADHWTPIHLDFAVRDLEAAVERAIGAGARVSSEVRSYPWGDIAVLRDPFGHGFCLIEFHGPPYDGVVVTAGN